MRFLLLYCWPLFLQHYFSNALYIHMCVCFYYDYSINIFSISIWLVMYEILIVIASNFLCYISLKLHYSVFVRMYVFMFISIVSLFAFIDVRNESTPYKIELKPWICTLSTCLLIFQLLFRIVCAFSSSFDFPVKIYSSS